MLRNLRLEEIITSPYFLLDIMENGAEIGQMAYQVWPPGHQELARRLANCVPGMERMGDDEMPFGYWDQLSLP
jgi:hypothetical protein